MFRVFALGTRLCFKSFLQSRFGESTLKVVSRCPVAAIDRVGQSVFVHLFDAYTTIPIPNLCHLTVTRRNDGTLSRAMGYFTGTGVRPLGRVVSLVVHILRMTIVFRLAANGAFTITRGVR